MAVATAWGVVAGAGELREDETRGELSDRALGRGTSWISTKGFCVRGEDGQRYIGITAAPGRQAACGHRQGQATLTPHLASQL